jgi:NSS family neurotransmitter:Na+ symporter
MSFFDSLDTLATNYMLPIGGLGIALVTGWRIARSQLREEFRQMGVFRAWYFLVRYVSPLAVVVILLHKIGVLGLN